MTTLLDAALAYAGRGWKPFPLVPNGKKPLTARGFHDGTNDLDQVRDWWTREPFANIGICPASTGSLVVDVDGIEGEAVAGRLGLLAEPTLECITGREAGRHRWFVHPGGHIGNVILAPKLEIRSDSGYIVAPPSVHPNGRVYRWVGRWVDRVALPPPMVERLTQPAPARALRPDVGDLIAEGSRNGTLTRLAGALRRTGASESLIRTALAAINAAHVSPPLTADDVDAIAESIGRYAPAAAQPVAELAAQAAARAGRYA